uniref:leucine-rich repeat domain-containing protein n=1 Tax=uncultured Ruminococcus sp. TaxID=165186 RepID=UPI0025F393B2
MKSKKILAGLLSLAFVFGGTALPAAVSSFDTAVTANADVFGDFSYRLLDDGTVEITRYYGSDTEVKVPAEIDGKAVSSINYTAFNHRSSLTSITIPDSVTSINNAAFSGCTSLTSITIPDSVTSIGYDAFKDTE